MYLRWLPVTIGVTLCAGCGDMDFDWFGKRDKVPAEERPKPERRSDPLFVDSVGLYTLYSGAEPLRIRGFGLVVGLGQNGSNDCPTTVREHLLEFMRKNYTPVGPGAHKRDFSAQRLFDSADSAAVQVQGVIPAGAPRGTIIDLQVESIPGTSTESIEGGLLLPCELRIYDVSASGEGLIEGRTVARAGGPIFTNPFTGSSERGGQRDQRRGFVLGGGRTIEDRTVQLQLLEPSYPLARRIERRLNERFGQSPKAAEAMSPGSLQLRTPPQFAQDPGAFLRLVPYVYLEDRAGASERRLQTLIERALDPALRESDLDAESTRLEQLTGAWEAFGASAIPELQPYYTSDVEVVRYYAARSGLRLGDASAVLLLAQFAKDASSAFARPAIRELGACKFPYAGEQLVPLLERGPTDLRVAAYQAMVKQRHPAVRSKVYPSVLDRQQVNLIVDEIDVGGSPFVFYSRRGVPRIALFGRRMPMLLPVFYSHPEDVVTVRAMEATGAVTLFARGRTSGRLSDAIEIAPTAHALVRAMADLPLRDGRGRLRGLGLPYSQIVQVLAELCNGEDPAIRAELVQEESILDVLPPTEMPDRPVGDEPAFEWPRETGDSASAATSSEK